MAGIHDAIADELAQILEWSARSDGSKDWARRRKEVWSLLRAATEHMGADSIELRQIERACGLVLDCLRETNGAELRPIDEAAAMIEQIRAVEQSAATHDEGFSTGAKMSTTAGGIRPASFVTHASVPQTIMRVMEIRGHNARCNWPAPYGKNSDWFPLRELATWPNA